MSKTMTKEQIQAVRLALRLTVAEFAECCNVSPRTVYRYEDGSRQVTGPLVALVPYLVGEAHTRKRRPERAA